MKIYFEDGPLRPNALIPYPVSVAVSADLGVSENIKLLDWYKENRPGAVAYTNSIFAFNNMYAWNEELNTPEIFIRAGNNKVFTRIDKLTNRELRQGHNLAKMYVSGEFDVTKV